MSITTAGIDVVMLSRKPFAMSKGRAHRMRSFSMERVVKRFAEDQPLQRRMLETAKITVAVNAPTQRKMIEYNMIVIVDRYTVKSRSIRLVLVPEANTQIPNDNMTAVFNFHRSVRQRYPFARGGLACNGQMRFILDLYILFQSEIYNAR